MKPKALVSIDFDFFVREEVEWDWGHRESTLFFEEIWKFRYSSKGVDIVRETDIDTYADFPPEMVLSELGGKHLNVFPARFGSAESHLAILDFYNSLGRPSLDLFINIDAHHDLYGPPPTKGKESCGNWWYRLYDFNPSARHVWIFPKWLSACRKDPTLSRAIHFCSWRKFETTPIEVVGVFFCRSGCWVPPHLDSRFNAMVGSIHPALEIPVRKGFAQQWRVCS